jgi:hypothetical protein
MLVLLPLNNVLIISSGFGQPMIKLGLFLSGQLRESSWFIFTDPQKQPRNPWLVGNQGE